MVGVACGDVNSYITDMMFLKKVKDCAYLHLSALVCVLQLKELVLFMELL